MAEASIFAPITPFSFTRPGTSIRRTKSVQNCVACRRRKTKCDRKWPCSPCKDRGEGHLCEPFVREPNDRPTGYTHVSDTSILANRVVQLELALSRLIQRVDNVDAYRDILYEFQDPLPVFRPPNLDEERSERQGNFRGEGTPNASGPLGFKADNDSGDEHRRRKSVKTSHDSPSTSMRSGSVSGSANTKPLPLPQMSTNVEATNPLPPQQNGPGRAQVGASPGNRSYVDQRGQPFNPAGPPPSSISQEHAPMSSTLAQTPNSRQALQHRRQSSPPTSSQWYGFQPTHPPLQRGVAFGLGNNNGQDSGGSGPASAVYDGDSKAPSVHEHDAALALEGLALGREVGFVERIGPVDDAIGEEATPPSAITFASFIQHKRPADPHSVVKSFPAITELPNIIVGRHLLRYFLENIDFRWRCLHRPTFERQFNLLAHRLRTKSNSHDFTRDELASLALYSTCLAVAIHLLDEDGYRELDLNHERAAALAETCWKVSYQALEAADWMQVHDIRSVQTVIIAGVYLSSVRRANLHWTLTGAATKIAMAMGLGGVPHEASIADGTLRIPPRWRSAIDREVGRRVWYCLLELDYLFSLEYGFIYLISPEQSHTSEPANINDVDIREGSVVMSQPTETYTDMSYFLQRIRLFYPFRDLAVKARRAGRIRYQFITEAHHQLQSVIDSGPSFYRSTEGLEQAMDATQLSKIKREQLAISEGADLRRLRLHRTYFSAACRNPRYALSKKTCLASARHLLDAQRKVGNTYPAIHPHYWAHTYCMFVSTVVSIIYLAYAEGPELDEWAEYSRSGVAQLRALATKGRFDLGDSADTLEALMRAQLTRRSEDYPPPEPPRRGDDEVGLHTWEGWLPAELMALLTTQGNQAAQLNQPHQPGNPALPAGAAALNGRDAGVHHSAQQGQPQGVSPLAPLGDSGFTFENMLDDFSLWQ